MNQVFRVLLLLIVCSHFSFAQKSPAVHSVYEWDAEPAIHQLQAPVTQHPATYILHRRFLELRIEMEPNSYFTEHKIIRINTNAGIEKFNKVYIPMHGGKQLLSLRVRSIDPSGNVTNLKPENLKELKNVDGFGNYKIFAVEGLTVGGEMEYVYTTKSAPQVYGREIFQHDVPVLNAELEIIYPDNFNFTAKSYNGLNKPEVMSPDERRKSIGVSATNIPALIEEEYSAYEGNKMRVDYKMESNGKVIGISWKRIAERFLSNSYESSATGKVNKFLKPLHLDGLSDLEKVQVVEKYIKSNFTLKNSGHDSYEDTKSVIENHVGSQRGILKLYMSCWESLNMSPQLVLCSNRFSGSMDPTFASPDDIDDVIFYFPSLKQYLTPGVPYLRLGAAPDNIAGNNALFIHYAFEGNRIQYFNHTFNVVEPLDYSHNDVGVRASINFNESLDLPMITQKNTWQGYRAARYRGYYYYQEKKDDFIKDVTLSGIDDANVIKRNIEGEDMNLSFDPENYFTITTQYTAPSLIERAGDDYLFSVGKIIGKQSELYQELKRQTDVEFNSISDYNHEIVIELPPGYTISGLEGIRINNELRTGDEVLMRFFSDYKLEGNKLTIIVNEVYKVVKVRKENYEDFRKVVNSAADFNKVVLVVQPESK